MLGICYIIYAPVFFCSPLLVIWSTLPEFYGGHLWITARLAGGVNLNYIRLDSPDHQLTTNDGDWIYSVTDRWTNRIDQGEIEAPTNVSDCYPLFTGKNFNHGTTVDYILAPCFNGWQYQLNTYMHKRCWKEAQENKYSSTDRLKWFPRGIQIIYGEGKHV